MDQLPELPREWKQELKGASSGTASVDLSTHRTQMSEHRTELSEHRTLLSNARSYMANERTHLAYFRTSLSLMSFGITLNRFSIYLRENKITTSHHGILRQTESVGLGMVLLGLALLIWALYRFRKVSHEIETDTYESPKESITIMTLAIIALGGVTAIWLFIIR